MGPSTALVPGCVATVRLRAPGSCGSGPYLGETRARWVAARWCGLLSGQNGSPRKLSRRKNNELHRLCQSALVVKEDPRGCDTSYVVVCTAILDAQHLASLS